MSHPDILYLIKESEDNEELKFSLRSLQNLPHGKIFFAGYKPSWVADNVIHIKLSQQEGQKYQNVKNNLLTAIKDPRLSDNFVLMNDDFFIMSPIEKIPALRRIKTIDHYIELFSKVDGDSHYVTAMRTTRDLLKSWGIDNIYSYELHVPFLYDKPKLLALIDRLGDAYYDVHLRTVYGNFYHIKGRPIKDVKIINDRQTISSTTRFLSSIDEYFAGTRVSAYLHTHFPSKSPYEK